MHICLLQNIYIPQDKKNHELFLSKSEGVAITNGKVLLLAKSKISTNTFFNIFSVAKFNTYCNLEDIFCQLDVEGSFTIKFCYLSKNKNSPCFQKPKVFTKTVKCEKRQKIRIRLDFKKCVNSEMLFYEIRSITDCVLYSSSFFGVTKKMNTSINFALCFCTYNRFSELNDNITNILGKIINNKQSILHNRLSIYIADNASNINVRYYKNKKVHIFHNPNYGGAGGFTRCLIESKFKHKTSKFSHFIFCDDDIILMPFILERSFCFLRVLKKEYENIQIAGINLIKEKPRRVWTYGMRLNGHETINNANNLDITILSNILTAETNKRICYNGWWYNVIPNSYVTEKNLPFPFFLHCDDKEYDARYKKEIICIAGIAIWHPDCIKKQATWIKYYDLRNHLIFHTRDCGFINKDYLLFNLNRALQHSFFYDYDSTIMQLKSIEDFLKGPSYLQNLDPSKLHKDIMLLDKTKSDEKCKVTSIEKKQIRNVYTLRFHRIKMLLLYFLPPLRRTLYISDFNTFNHVPLFYNKIVSYKNKFTERYVYKKSYIRFFKALSKYISLRHKIKKKFDFIIEDWRTNMDKLITLDFWCKYLHLNRKHYHIPKEKPIEFDKYKLCKDGFVYRDTLLNFIDRFIYYFLTIVLRFSKKRAIDYIWFKHFNKRLKKEAKKRIKSSKVDPYYGDLLKFKDIHKNERCFICGTGPSLSFDDLKKLSNEIVFGVNNIILLFNKTKWRPKYLGISDRFVFDILSDYFNCIGSKTKVFVGNNAIRNNNYLLRHEFSVYPDNNTYKFYGELHKDKYKARFSDNPYYTLYDGYTVVYSMIQLAVYMGFTEIYLLGCDCSYQIGKNNHFMESGHKISDKAIETAYDRLMAGYVCANKYVSKHKNIKIYNATRGGKLEIFPRVKLEDVLNK